MPLLNNEGLDDAPTWDAAASFSGGQVSYTRPNLLDPEQSAEMLNLDISKTGEVVTRRGCTEVGTGLPSGSPVQALHYFDTASYQRIVAVVNGTFYSFDGSTWGSHPVGGVEQFWSPSALIYIVQGINKIYITDGIGEMYSWDGATWTALGFAANNQPPFASTTLCWHTSRLFAAGMTTEPDAIYASEFLVTSPYWDKALWNVRVGGGEGDPISGLLAWTNFNLLVLKKRSMWIVDADPTVIPAEWEITPIHRRIGCIAPKTAVQVGADVLCLTDSGVRSIQRTIASERQNEVSPPLSFPVQDVIDRINPSAIHKACAFYWDNRYMLSVPLDSSTVNNYMLVFNTFNSSWSGLWTGWQTTSFAARGYGDEATRLVMGQNTGSVYEWMDYIQQDDETDIHFVDPGAAAIPTQLITRAFTFREPACKKTGFNTEFEFNLSSSDVVVEVIRDDAAPETYESFSTLTTGLTLPLTLPATFPKAGILRKQKDLQRFDPWREMQFKVTTASKKVALRSISASAFINTVDLQS